jgi:TetR/AcrR family transcriptional regulator, mexCD-oprJ operon repressor
VGTGAGLRDRVAAGILDAAAAVLAERGDAASMADVAVAAGVGRATLYRYFPNRDVLLDALAEVGLAEMRRLIAEAELDKVPVREGVARVARGFVAAGSKYVALMPPQGVAGRALGRNDERSRRLVEPLHELFRRGAAQGVLRADLPAEVLLEMFGYLLMSAIQRTTRDQAGVEQASAEITSVFLDGVHR